MAVLTGQWPKGSACGCPQGNGLKASAALANGINRPHDNADVDDGGLNNLAHVAGRVL
jgi:hypothetical protein